MIHPYAFLVLAIAAFALILGAHVLSKNPYHRPGRAFFLLMSLTSARCILHAGLLHSPDAGTALLWGKAVMASTILLSGSACYLTSFLPYSRYRGWPAKRARLFWAAVIALAVFFGLSTDQVAVITVGYGIDYSAAALAGYAVCLGLVVAASFIALTARQGSKDASFSKSILLLAFAPLFPSISMLFLVALGFRPLMAPGLLVTALVYAFLVLKHKVLSISSSGRASRPIDTVRGDAILMEGRSLRPAYDVFLNYLDKGHSGMIICRSHPDRVREELVRDVPMLWLSSQPGPDRVDPTSLNILLHSATAFIERSAPAVILLEGVEYLISQNSVDKVLRMLYALRDAVTVAGSKLIVILDPDVLYERDLALMEKEFDLQKAEA